MGPLVALGIVLLAATPALAAETAKAGPSEAVFIAQIILLLSVGRLMGELMQRLGQPAVMGQLLAGLLLGPSVLGALWPEAQHAIFPTNVAQKSMIDAVSQLGILMLLLLTGMETDLSLVRKTGRAALSVSAAGIAVPFACGFALGEFLPEAMLPRPELRLVASLFLGTVVSISSVKIVAMVVREMRFMRRNVGQVIVASAIIDDTIGWTIIAIIFGLALHGALDLETLARSVIGTALFLVVSFTFGRWLVFTLIRWTNDTFVSDMPVITTILVVMGLMALDHQPDRRPHGARRLRGRHSDRTVADSDAAHRRAAARPHHSSFHASVLRAGWARRRSHDPEGPESAAADPGSRPDRQPGQIRGRVPRRVAWRADAPGGAGAGLRDERPRVDRSDRGHDRPVDGRAEPEPLHDDRRHGGRDDDGDAADVALDTRRLPLRDDERARLEREAFEAGGFVTNLERLLVAVDGSAKEPVRRAPCRAACRIARHAGHGPRPRHAARSRHPRPPYRMATTWP